AGAGKAAWIAGGQALQLDLGVGTEKVGWDFRRIDAQLEVQRVVDDVLGEFKLGVENMIPGDPAGRDAVGSDDVLLTDHVLLQPIDVIGTKLLRPSARDAEANKAGSSSEKAHNPPKQG